MQGRIDERSHGYVCADKGCLKMYNLNFICKKIQSLEDLQKEVMWAK